MAVLDLVWLIPAFPLLGFLLLLVGGRKLGEPRAGWLATLLMAGSFVATLAVFGGLVSKHAEQRQFSQVLFTWLPVGRFSVDIGFLVDPLSITMCLFITGVGTLIHLYSIGYMHGDEKFSKFFLYLNLFAFSMLMLVLGDNMLVTFLGWEGVGMCSYFLISFWHASDANASAGKKAFVTNRIGDWGFMVAMFLSFSAFGTIKYTELFDSINKNGIATTTATAIAVLLFVGACGKSAQFPLYLWLPDAMAGPTPVSALIHAATMVTSGVYLMTRTNPILAEASAWVPTLIAWVGVGTALFAATIAIAQNDIKKVLAYSTVSQLGYMFLAVGSGAYVAAIFHMVTHAFFKALLFLGSGSVIHGMHDDQDMRHYGNLRKFMPITAVTFIVGWLAIAGVPPFSGFFSKDEILAAAMDKSPALWAVGLLTALLTAFYMSRQVFLTFFGRYRYADARPDEIDAAWNAKVSALRKVADEAKGVVTKATDALTAARSTLEAAVGDDRGPSEQAVAEAERWSAEKGLEAADAQKAASALAMRVHQQPRAGLSLLAPPDVAEVDAELTHDIARRREFHPHEAGWLMWVPLAVLAIASFFGGALNLPFWHRTKFLESWLDPVLAHPHELSFGGAKLVALGAVAVIAGLAGIAIAAAVYLRGKADPAQIELPILAHGWRYDSSVAAFMGGPGRQIFEGAALADRVGVDGAVNGVATLVRETSGLLRRLQNGLVRTYAAGIALGAGLLVAYFFVMAKAG